MTAGGASTRAASWIGGGPVLITTALAFSWASVSALRRWRVAAVGHSSGDDISLPTAPPATARYSRGGCDALLGLGMWAVVNHLQAEAAGGGATAWPMAPKPTMPRVLPCTRWLSWPAPPAQPSLAQQPLAAADCVYRWPAAGPWRDRPCPPSPRVLLTWIPRAAAASRSILSIPTPKLTISPSESGNLAMRSEGTGSMIVPAHR